MFPSWDQIQRAAYEHWERRGRIHGSDREDWVAAEMDLTFDMNYRAIAEFSLSQTEARVLGNQRHPRCRFCEQSAPQVRFRPFRPAVPDCVGNTSLFTAEICDPCADQFAGTIEPDFWRFWQALDALRAGAGGSRETLVPTGVPIGAYKGLIRIALTLMPERELSSFTDTIEWVGNPDHEFDSSLVGGTGCLAYQVHVPFAGAWTSLAQRIEEDAPFPYMLFFLASGSLVLQLQLPLCTWDEDLDGTEVRLPRRSFSTGIGSDLRASPCLALPLKPTNHLQPRRKRLLA